jgi:hypothetical protein
LKNFPKLTMMKRLNAIYWTSTILIALFMGFSGIQNLLMTQDSINLISRDLGYPQYIIPFLGLAKLLGSIGLLMPISPRLKEWAYAGLFFDLVGAVFSGIAVNGFDPLMLTLIIPFGLMGLSYGAHWRKLQLQGKS